MSARAHFLLACGLLSAIGPGAAQAADLLPAAPLPELRGTVTPDIEVSGFYLRGDIGFSNQSVERLSNSLDALGTIEKVSLGFAGAPLAGLGAGYQFNRWFRADVTGEYRSAATFTGLERYRDASLPLGYGTDEYTATKRDVVVLANPYPLLKGPLARHSLVFQSDGPFANAVARREPRTELPACCC